MAKLVIFRADAHHADIKLPEHAVQIGRSPQNDVVLEDRGKGVSRTHAELRFEGGYYHLVDKGSHNGIWVSGARVASVVLTPGVVAGVGPYRLAVESAPPTAELASPEDPTAIAVRPARQADPAEESTARGGPAGEDRRPVTPPIDTTPSATRTGSQRPRVLALTAAAVLSFGVVGYGLYTVFRPASPKPPAFDLAAATKLVDAGDCAGALGKYIGPALERVPADPIALRLKARCQPPPEPRTPAPQPSAAPAPVEVMLNDADIFLASNQKPANKECQAALDKVNEVLAADPANERAVELKKSVEACLQPAVPGKPAAPVWIAPIEPESGGLPPLPKESPQQHEARVRYAEAKYKEAQTRWDAGDYDGAEQALSGLPANFRGVAELRNSFRTAKNQTQAAELMSQARVAAERKEFLKAEEVYRRAKDLDTNLSIDRELQDVQARRLQLAQTVCKQAEARFSFRADEETRRLYGDALKLLRPGELCYEDAAQRGK